MKKQKHPLQPIHFDKHRVARFRKNKIVEFLLDNNKSGIHMNSLSMMGFDKNDRWQFAQLIGYSVNGIGDLSYCDKKQLAEADEIVEQMVKEQDERRKAKARTRSL